ncbi:hypothetical protein TWF481_002572 [Arthrobotrys musiformis]|uniref:BTB domain-containing protein n=1 Tax=Arthrobotrys musiformis TaxID=47236 RepID=A0AAV9VRN1_9PEZI
MNSAQREFSRLPDLIIKLTRRHSISDNSEATSETLSTEKVYVSAAALRNASPVWRRMLNPENGFQSLPTEEFGNTELPVLSLEDDDADSMLILLRISMHYRNRAIPKSLSYEQLLEIAILCDKYDCGDLVHPWPSFWIKELMQNGNQLKPGYEGWLRIGHTFMKLREWCC